MSDLDAPSDPLPPGLPNTDIDACRELMLAVIVQGLQDDDLDYVISPTFMHHCCYVGLDPDAAFKVKIAYLRQEIDMRNLSLMRLHRNRVPRLDREPAIWPTWKSIPAW